jgi:predicted AAA+ superfamily ATPase
MIPRLAEDRIRKLAAQFPIVVITGPRQSGKTTTAKALFPGKEYLNLERPDLLERMRQDPMGTLMPLRSSGAVIDEAQRFPEIASWLQTIVDEDPRPGAWILTGSSQPLLRQAVSQSLAGRAAYAELLPFCRRELADDADQAGAATDAILWKGWYPPIYDRAFEPSDWYEQYVATYLERDLSQLMRVKDPALFRRFLMLCAGRSGQVLNVSDLARDAGTSHSTAREWLSVLESGYLIHFLRPWHENFQKRIVKNPKLYFMDCGLASWLIGLRRPEQWAAHPLRGALFETLVVSDAVKESKATGSASKFYFWSSPRQGEIDLVRIEGETVYAAEIKSSGSFRPELASGLLRWSALSGVPAERLRIIYDGAESFAFKGIAVAPWRG